MKLILPIVAIFLHFTAHASSRRYYCYNNPDKMLWHDKIIIVEGEEPLRAISDTYIKKERYKAYDEGNKIISVYYDHPHSNYRIIQLNLSSEPVSYSYGYGYHRTPESFEKSYQIPFSDENLAQFNTNPELIKYLPERPEDKNLSHTSFKQKMDCKPLNMIEYPLKSIMLFLIKLGSAG